MRSRPIFIFASMLLLAVVAVSCKRGNEKRYDLKGKVVAVEPDKHLVTIAHEEIKDYMPSMTMPFMLPNEYYLQNLASGDEINATLVVDGSHSWLEDIVITRESADPSATTGISEAKEGDEVPSFQLVNQDGKEIRLQNYRGKVLVLTFIYTRCPLPEYCSLMSSNFAKIDRELEKQPELYQKTHLLSITIDPEYDTPSVLRSYGAAHTERYQDETFAHWEFAGGSADQVKGVAQYFGLRYFNEKDQIVHGLRTVIVSPTGKVVKVFRGNDWKPDELLKDLPSAVNR
jgi:protein SCO1/2